MPPSKPREAALGLHWSRSGDAIFDPGCPRQEAVPEETRARPLTVDPAHRTSLFSALEYLDRRAVLPVCPAVRDVRVTTALVQASWHRGMAAHCRSDEPESRIDDRRDPRDPSGGDVS